MHICTTRTQTHTWINMQGWVITVYFYSISLCRQTGRSYIILHWYNVIPAVNTNLGKTAFGYFALFVWNSLQSRLKLDTDINGTLKNIWLEVLLTSTSVWLFYIMLLFLILLYLRQQYFRMHVFIVCHAFLWMRISFSHIYIMCL